MFVGLTAQRNSLTVAAFPEFEIRLKRVSCGWAVRGEGER